MKILYLKAWFFFCFPLTLFGHIEEGSKPRICLNMIVKNESHVIERAIASVKSLIDYWVIVDTGSSDGTQEVIRKALEDMPGELYERPWRDFGYNRTEALELAKGKADYMLFLDADDWLEESPDFVLSQLDADVYWARWQSYHVPSFSYMKPLLVKDTLRCHWEGVIHEYITWDYAKSQETLTGLTYVFSSQGSRSRNPKKFQEAARVLEEALKEEPDNARYVFYLAESYRDANYPSEALLAYERRAHMGGWQEEVFWSLLQTAHLKKVLNYSYEEVLESYFEAHRQNPSRSEPIYYIAELYNQNSAYQLAYDCIKCWQRELKSDKKDILFCMGWVEDYGLSFQLSIASFYVSHYQESLDLHEELLANPRLPPLWQEQVLRNREFPLRYLEAKL
jgi:glycosyltransferase involved in cell wall biosynthesis